MHQTKATTPRCIAPFVSIAVWADGNSIICCEDKGQPIGHLNNIPEMSELINSPRMRKIRKQFMAGETPARCEFCLQEADRQPTIYHYYQHHFDWKQVAHLYNSETGRIDKTRYLLIALSNFCTYSCRMCFEKLSTRLSRDRQRMFGSARVEYRPNDIDKVIRFIRKNPLQIVTFHGGNPIQEPRFLDVLSALSNGTIVEIITNGSTLISAGEDIRPHLKRFREVRFNLSLDGTRHRTEYIRVHSDFENVYLHFQEMLEIPNATVNIHNTITNLNLFDLPEYYSMVLWGEFSSADSISSYIATEPRLLNVTNMPEDRRLEAEQRLNHFLQIATNMQTKIDNVKLMFARSYVKNIFSRMASTPFDPLLYSDFIEKTKREDLFYGFSTLPEFSTDGDHHLLERYPTAERSSHENKPKERRFLIQDFYSSYIPPPNDPDFDLDRVFQEILSKLQHYETIVLRVRLNPDNVILDSQLADLKCSWLTHIEKSWNNDFFRNGSENRPKRIDVRWANDHAHFEVRVRRGPGRSNMTTWHTTDSGAFAARQVGHMLQILHVHDIENSTTQ